MKKSIVVVGSNDAVVRKLDDIVTRAGAIIVSHDLGNIPKGADVMLGVYDEPSLEFALSMKDERDPALGLIIVVLECSLRHRVRNTRATKPHTRIIAVGCADTSTQELADTLANGWRAKAA